MKFEGVLDQVWGEATPASPGSPANIPARTADHAKPLPTLSMLRGGGSKDLDFQTPESWNKIFEPGPGALQWSAQRANKMADQSADHSANKNFKLA